MSRAVVARSRVVSIPAAPVVAAAVYCASNDARFGVVVERVLDSLDKLSENRESNYGTTGGRIEGNNGDSQPNRSVPCDLAAGSFEKRTTITIDSGKLRCDIERCQTMESNPLQTTDETALVPQKLVFDKVSRNAYNLGINKTQGLLSGSRLNSPHKAHKECRSVMNIVSESKTTVQKSRKPKQSKADKQAHKIGLLIHELSQSLKSDNPTEVSDAYDHLVGIAKLCGYELGGKAVVRVFEAPEAK